jgi:putative transposase
MPQSYASLNCHVIFSTKNRAPLIDTAFQPSLFAYMGGVLKDIDCVLMAAGGMPDHVHLLVSMSREIAVAPMVRTIKANSSKWVHETFSQRSDFAWQAGYGAFSVSHSNLDAVRAYLQNQAEHHRVRTFQEEFVEFLRKHEVEYDERYLWE